MKSENQGQTTFFYHRSPVREKRGLSLILPRESV